jgi:hypothetical protein
MPSRPAVAVILLFWAVVTGYVVRREVLPRYFADTPPHIDFVLVDELSSATVTWGVYRERKKVGTMSSRTEHLPADDTFRFSNTYRGLRFEFEVPIVEAKVGFDVPTASTAIRVGRDGRLREQTMSGTFEVSVGGLSLGAAKAEVDGRVVNGELVGRARLDPPKGMADKPFEEELVPVPVPDGQAMNPLMPVDRLAGVTPGKRWTVRHTDPVSDSLRLLMMRVLKEKGVDSKLLPTAVDSPQLLAEVLADPESLPRADGAASCWVIRYESADKAISARTYVRRDDGRVLRQEAGGLGVSLRFERED